MRQFCNGSMSNNSDSNSNGGRGMRRGLCTPHRITLTEQDNNMEQDHEQDRDRDTDQIKGTGRGRGRGLRNLRALFSTIKNTFTAIATITVNKKSRRRRLTETNQTPCHSPATPQTRCRKVLGRTPAKLYSPFGIETPHNDFKSDSIYNPDTPEHGFSPKKKNYKFSHQKWNIVSRRPRALFR